jgi:hypothetical protein
MFRCSGPDRSSCDSGLPFPSPPTRHRRDIARPWHPKRNQTSKFSKDRTVRLFTVLLTSNDPSYMRTKAENKVLDYVKRVRIWQSNASMFSSSSPLLDKPSIRGRRHLRQPERRCPQNRHAEGPPRARRKGRAHAENIRYSLPSSHFLINFLIYIYAQM